MPAGELVLLLPERRRFAGQPLVPDFAAAIGRGDRVSYQIVGDLESDLKQRKISISSPISRALIGKHEGDTITIEAPGGSRDYDIVGVRYVG